MRFAAILLAGLTTAATAAAQNEPVRFGFQPIPNTLPEVLFAPDSLAGKLLRPLGQRANTASLPEIETEPAALALAPSDALPDAAELAVAQTEEPLPEAAPTVESAPEPAPPADEVLEPGTEASAEPTPEEVSEEPPTEVDPNASIVTVIVENVESASGNVNVAVCDKDLSREGCPYVREVKAQQGFVETQFRDIPPGTYAVVGYHDVNGNDEFDKLFGMPREPYALSSKAAEKLVPTFADAALTIKAGDNAIIIRLKRLGG